MTSKHLKYETMAHLWRKSRSIVSFSPSFPTTKQRESMWSFFQLNEIGRSQPAKFKK